jgi:hypothetical protein
VANKKDRHPKAYFDAARGYQSAADQLLLSIESGEKLLIRDPTYFLYAHAVELALKACLLSSGFDPASAGPAGHSIEGLYQECRGHKLLGANDVYREINSLVYFLGTGNECHQYRYPDKLAIPRAIPVLPWTREVVARLIAEVEPHVMAWVAANPRRQQRRNLFGQAQCHKASEADAPGPLTDDQDRGHRRGDRPDVAVRLRELREQNR